MTEPVTGSNWWTDVSTGLNNIIGNDKAQMLKNVRRVVGRYSSLSDLADSLKSIRPVYKVMITMPHLEGGEVKSYRYILADTSRPYVNFLSKGDSPVIGMWVDQSDLIEPDKCILLIHNPMGHESGTFESDILRFPQFGARNWLDVWIGYAPVTPGRSLMNLGQAADKIDMASLRIPGLDKVAFTIPDPFFFGNESHVFSGPIVSIKREVKPTGDRLQIVGFSPIILFRGMRAKKFEIEKDIRLGDAIVHTARSMGVFPNLAELSSFERDDEIFYNGQFTWNMVGFDNYRVDYRPGISLLGGEMIPHVMKISPVMEFEKRLLRSSYPLSHPWKDHDDILGQIDDEDFVLRSKVESSKKTTLYDILFRRLTDPTLTGLYGLYAFIRPTPTPSDNVMWAFRDGEGHPGVHVKYGFKFEIDGIMRQIEEEKNYGPEMRQTITLGRTAREFEAGIEYGTVFNTKQFMMKTGEEGELKDLICPTGKLFVQKISETSGKYDDQRKFWDALYNDISVYGETFSPTMTWLWGEGDQSVDLESGKIAKAVAQIMRESYFAGMGGTVFAVGNSSLKPGRILDVKDERTTLSQDLRSKIASTVKDRIAVLGNVRTIPASPVALRLKGVDKMFYIWKVRHYLGVNSGYISKLYFIEERNRAWQQYTESIDAIIGAALAQAKQLMGVT